MRITRLAVQNYRPLKDIEIPMSKFGCLIGENNTGKSSVLQAISLFFSGSSLTGQNYFDETTDIRIAVTFEGITDDDLSLLADEHANRIRPIVRDRQLSLVRCYGTDGKSRLRYVKLMPRQERFHPNAVDDLVRDQKAGAAFVSRVIGLFPELQGRVNATMNQGQVRTLIQELADELPDDEKELMDVDLPTGIDKSIIPMLPEPIYIPAVKDLADDVKTKESTPFGKILGILLKAIEGQMAEETELFARLSSKLNRVVKDDNSIEDGRLEEIKVIERTVEQYVKDSFSYVSLNIKIPPPEMKTILAGAQIWANDGVDGLVDFKGDGLRRAVVFAILRAYVDLNKPGALGAEELQNAGSGGYILLFEEPELYLHPRAQHILFAALSKFSQTHHVLVTTHSPDFFGPQATATFVKFTKDSDKAVAGKPFSVVHAVDLGDVDTKDQFQIICYENNNAAFFSETIVLVEGDSDYLVLPHVARTINQEWDCGRCSVAFARINGKSSIRRYKKFFDRFNARVIVVTDLDLLVSDFDKIDPPGELNELRSALLQRADALVPEREDDGPSMEDVKKAQGRRDMRFLWERVRAAMLAFGEGKAELKEVEVAAEEFLAWEKGNARIGVLQNSNDEELLRLKRELLQRLREIDVFVLDRGAIEAYYPPGINGDKPTMAQQFCDRFTTREEVLALCSDLPVGEDGEMKKEFEIILGRVFTP